MNRLGLGIFGFYTNAGQVRYLHEKHLKRAPGQACMVWIVSNPNPQKNTENPARLVRVGVGRDGLDGSLPSPKHKDF
jgi:hypothetical protein